MKVEQNVNWWKERLSGLEIDCCPAVDLPDNDAGGAFAACSLPFAAAAGRDAPITVPANTHIRARAMIPIAFRFSILLISKTPFPVFR